MSYTGRCSDCRKYTNLEVVRIKDRFGVREIYICTKCKEQRQKEGR